MTTLLTVKEPAGQLNVSAALVYSLISGRKLRFIRVGNGRGRIRIPEDAIGEYLARSTFGVEEKREVPISPRRRLRHLDL